MSLPHSSVAPGSRLAVVVIAAAAAALAGCHSKTSEDPRTQPPKVVVVKPAKEQGNAREFSGVVSARVQSSLGFRVGGKVVERLVDVGQSVRKGQPLFRLDPIDLDLAISAKRAELTAAKAIAIRARAEDQRQTALIKNGATSHQLFEEARAAADSSAAQVERLEAELNVAENSAAYSTLGADADGIVLETLAEPGQVVQIGQTVLRLAHAGPREASVYLPETVRPAIGSTARASLFGGSSTITARLRQLSNTADPDTRTFEARYVLDGIDASSPLGATVSIKIDDSGTLLTVPNAAVTDRGRGPGVWLIDRASSRVTFRSISIDRVSAESTVVSGGLNGNEELVALGAHLLSDGQQVRIAGTEQDSQ